MLVFLGIMRRINLGAPIVLLLALILKHKAPVWFVLVCLLLSIPGYALFVFFTSKYLKTELFNFLSNDKYINEDHSYFSTLWKCIIIDVFSPITFFVDFYGGFIGKLITFISTYVTILFYYILFCLIT